MAAITWTNVDFRDHFVYVPSQWEAMLGCNVMSHWIGAQTKWSLCLTVNLTLMNKTNEIWIKLPTFSLNEMHFRISSHKCQRFLEWNAFQNIISQMSAIFSMCMITLSNGNIFRITDPLCGEFTSHRWIPHTKAIDAELWSFLWFAPEINRWVNNHEAGDLRRHHAHYDIVVMLGDTRRQVMSNHDINIESGDIWL